MYSWIFFVIATDSAPPVKKVRISRNRLGSAPFTGLTPK